MAWLPVDSVIVPAHTSTTSTGELELVKTKFQDSTHKVQINQIKDEAGESPAHPPV